MKRIVLFLLTLVCILSVLCILVACDSSGNNMLPNTPSDNSSGDGAMQVKPNPAPVPNPPSESIEEISVIYLKIGDRVLSATLVDNSSTRALKDLLANGPLVLDMNDYANFEKVGDLGVNLPRNDEYIVTEPCDLILYLGSRFVIYYDTNSYTFTRLGKINDITQSELMQILGDGSVRVVLSLSI